MSALTTLELTREDAIETIRCMVPRLSDEKLCSLMYELCGVHTGNNFVMVAEYDLQSRVLEAVEDTRWSK